MTWSNLIEKLIKENGGSASLSFLYENAAKYIELPSGDWRKTLRGVLYRDVRKDKFKKVGLGVYAFPDFPTASSAYSYAHGKKDPLPFITRASDPHSTIEGMLLELGNFYGYLTYTCDKKKSFDGKSLASLEGVTQIPKFTYQELVDITTKIDVVWFAKRGTHVFPRYFYEVEHSTDFTVSLLKMYQLLGFDACFVLTSWETRKGVFDTRVNQEPFYAIKQKFLFRSFETVAQLYFVAAQHYDLQSQFLGS